MSVCVICNAMSTNSANDIRCRYLLFVLVDVCDDDCVPSQALQESLSHLQPAVRDAEDLSQPVLAYLSERTTGQRGSIESQVQSLQDRLKR